MNISIQSINKHKFFQCNVVYLLTAWCRVLLEELTGLQLVKKFPAFHGTRRFIAALRSVRHLSLSWASPIQSIYPTRCTNFSQFIFGIKFCVFQTVPLSNVRSFSVYTQQWYMSHRLQLQLASCQQT